MSTAIATMPKISSVPICGDEIHALQVEDGGIHVVIRRICESFELDFATQLRKLRSCHWARVGEMTIPDPRGCAQTVCVLPADDLPMWLVTIHANKIAKQYQEKLKTYQIEARDALARHFRPPSPLPVAPKDPILATLESVAEVRRLQLEHEERLAAVEVESMSARALALAASSKADAALASSSGDTGFMALLGFCRLHGLQLTRAELAATGRALTKKCESLGIPVRTTFHETYAKVNLYPVALLEAWLASRRARIAS